MKILSYFVDYHYYYHVEDILIEPGPGDDYIELKGESAHNFEFEIPEGVPVKAIERPIQILKDDGEILIGKMNLIVW